MNYVETSEKPDFDTLSFVLDLLKSILSIEVIRILGCSVDKKNQKMFIVYNCNSHKNNYYNY